jgi:hypothetical protein
MLRLLKRQQNWFFRLRFWSVRVLEWVQIQAVEKIKYTDMTRKRYSDGVSVEK